MSTPEQSEPFLDLARRYGGGDDAAGDPLCADLRPRLRAAASRLLGPGAAEIDDIVQDSLVAILGYLRKTGGFEGDLIRFAVTVTRNRCRNLLVWRSRHPASELEPQATWLADPGRSALDALLEAEASDLLQAGLDSLDHGCRNLLRQYYFDGEAIERIRQRIGLDTVQGVYYRRSICLRQLARFLNDRLQRGS